MIAIQAIALATMMRFLSMRPDRSRCSSIGQSACSAIVGSASLENVSETSDSWLRSFQPFEASRSSAAS